MNADQIKGFIADIARPYAIITTSSAVSAAIVIAAGHVTTGEGGAAVVGAAFLGLGTLYGAKAVENIQAGKHAANVEMAKAAAPAASDTSTSETLP